MFKNVRTIFEIKKFKIDEKTFVKMINMGSDDNSVTTWVPESAHLYKQRCGHT